MQLNNDFSAGKEFLLSARYRPLRHIIFLVFFFFYFMPYDVGITSGVYVYKGLLTFSYLITASYFTIYVLVPRYLLKGKVLLFILTVFLVSLFFFVVICINTHLLHTYVDKELYSFIPFKPKEFTVRFIYYLFSFLVLILVPISIKIVQHWVKNLEQLNELQQINFDNELAILKNQVSPHFLFNTLNNINILTERNPKLASKLIFNLSDLLRYQLYSSSGETVFLKSDISFIENFLFVESQRKDNFRYSIDLTGDNKDVFLPPLLFIPFVENSVKHINQENPYVNIRFHLDKHHLRFSCVNSIGVAANQINEEKGIGLTNIRKRLQLLYPGNHELVIESKDNVFTVILNISL